MRHSHDALCPVTFRCTCFACAVPGAKPNGAPVKSQCKKRVSVGPLSAKDAAADARETANSSVNSQAEFVSEKKFKGQRDGYVFQSGPQGVGYYLDR